MNSYKNLTAILFLILSACSPKNEQKTSFETKTEALASFTDTSTASVDFGDPVTTSTTRIFTFKNTGDSAGSGTATLSGANATSFSIILQTGCATVNVGSTCTVRVNFNPSGKTVGRYSADLNIGGTTLKTLQARVDGPGGSTSAGSSTIEASISGVVISNPLDYGSFSSTQSSTKIIRLTNKGTSSIGPHTATLSDGDFTFTLNSCSSKTLAPNAYCDVRVTFSASSKTAQEYLTDLTFGTSTFPLKATVTASGGTTTTGGGTPSLAILEGNNPVAEPLDYGSFSGTQSLTKILTVKNTGTSSVVVNPTLSNTDFTFTLNSCSNKTLAPNGSCSVRVTFSAGGKTAGDKTSTLTVHSSKTLALEATVTGGVTITYQLEYSNHGTCSASQVCSGVGSQTRTATCRQLNNGIPGGTVSLSNCPTPTLSQTCNSPAGTKPVSITGGTQTVSCPAGSNTETFVSVICDSGYIVDGEFCTVQNSSHTVTIINTLPYKLQFFHPESFSLVGLEEGESETVTVTSQDSLEIGLLEYYPLFSSVSGMLNETISSWNRSDIGDVNFNSNHLILTNITQNITVSPNALGSSLLTANNQRVITLSPPVNGSIHIESRGGTRVQQGESPLNVTVYDKECLILRYTPTYQSGGLKNSLATFLNWNLSVSTKPLTYRDEVRMLLCSPDNGEVVSVNVNPGPSGYDSISLGTSFGCAIGKIDKKVYCWGNNSEGNLGNGTQTNSLNPVAVDFSGDLSGETVKKISVGDNADYACLLTNSDLMYCWGANYVGQLGNNSTTRSLVPIQINSGSLLNRPIMDFHAGASGPCATDDNGHAHCWGYNGDGRIGDGTFVPSTGAGVNGSKIPKAVLTTGVLSSVFLDKIFINYSTSCALDDSLNYYCWGSPGGDSYFYGDGGSNEFYSGPGLVTLSGGLSGKTIKKVSMGSNSSCAIANENNRLYCWGANYQGNVGHSGDPQNPGLVSGEMGTQQVLDVAVGFLRACAIAADKKIYCWGERSWSGNYGTAPVSLENLYPILQGKNFKSVSMASFGRSTCAVAENGEAYCWGENEQSELGVTYDGNFVPPRKMSNLPNN